MTFLAPWWLLGLVVVPALLLWGLLAPRGRRVTVGSLVLWRRALSGGAAGRPTARLRLEDPLLWLDASCILFVILACARPAFRTNRPLEPVATVVLDRTASMEMPSDGPEGLRWKDAHRMLAGVLEGVGSAPLRVVHVPGPEGVVRAERMAADDLLDWYGFTARALPASEDVWQPTAAEAGRRPQQPILLVTDVAPDEPLPGNVYVLATGGPTRNAGLERVCGRRKKGGAEEPGRWLLVTARAAEAAPGPYALRLYRDVRAGGAPTFEIEGFLSPGERVERVLAPEVLQGGFPSVVWLEGPGDGFPEDNRAYGDRPSAEPLRVLLVGEAPAVMRRALEASADVDVTEVLPPSAPTPDETDVLVAYRAGIPADWPRPAAVIAPPDAAGPVRPGEGTVAAEWHVAEDHPLADALYLAPPRIDRVPHYDLAPEARVLVGTREAPLIVTWTQGGAKRLAVLFDVAATDWPRRASFPVFWTRAVSWLRAYRSRVDEAVRYGTDGPADVVRREGRLPDTPGTLAAYGANVSFIGSGEGFQAGSGRDDSQAAIEAIEASIEARREATLADAWPWAVALVLLVLAARAWVAR